MIVDRDSKEGKEYMIKRIRHNFTVNKLVYGMILLPLLYLPFHFIYSQAVMWRDYESPYYAPPDQKQKWRKNKYRKEEEEVAVPESNGGWFSMVSGWWSGGASSSTPIEGTATNETSSSEQKLQEFKSRQAEMMGGGAAPAAGTRSPPKMRPLFLREDGEGKGGDWGFTSRQKQQEEANK
jgi:hypothetical protein